MARRPWRVVRSILVHGAALLMGWAVGAQTPSDADLAATQAATKKTFQEKVAPFVSTYCTECHGDKKRKGGISFSTALKNPGGTAFQKQWKQAASVIQRHDMPPEDAKMQPTPEEAATFIEWVANSKYLSSKDPGPFVIRRLNRTELGNTLHDLLSVDPAIVGDLPEEVTGAGYLNTLSPLLMEQYLSIASAVLERALAPENAPPNAIQTRLFGPTPPPGTDPREEARKVAVSLARSAFRRPAAQAEIDVLLRVFDLAKEDGRSYPSALRLMLKAVLVSPQFLFITPAHGPETANEIIPLDDHQLASRLSYLLWSTMPDSELFALADAGKLHEPEVLAAQVRRLLASPRSRALFDGFGAQWLGVGKLAAKTFDTAKFPQMTPALRRAMYDEARLLFETIVRENRSTAVFIESDFTFLNDTLAPLYGLEKQVAGPQMRRVQLTNPQRGGILSMPGILANTSFPDRTSPVNRGVWVLEQVLGEHVPPPPPNVPSLEKQDKRKVASLTLRQRTELHRTNPVCASCHKILDPIGFGLENFDAIGRWRDQDENGGAIDAAGELPGAKHFSSPRELRQILSERAGDLSRNLAGKLLAYALCRQLEGYDEIVLDGMSNAIAQDGFRMQTLIIKVVTSYPFTHRRIHEQAAPPPNAKKMAH